MRGFNERELKKLVVKRELSSPRVDSDGSGYRVRFDLGMRLRDASRRDEADGMLTTFRGPPKRFRSHRTLILSPRGREPLGSPQTELHPIDFSPDSTHW